MWGRKQWNLKVALRVSRRYVGVMYGIKFSNHYPRFDLKDGASVLPQVGSHVA
ncbi:hypothetical protein CORMATOL_02663 [Corynebacterium matruchotii ATCC 33806]|uniref:Uncharacterized protein n=1 Tax=Corynebacterium matruchotii ATCC 33806 TaxID=566549 RepID=C0E6M8_9CORY|nr:hypothetical protein CORMATOL_02663 [Corynebacterium matruchotii ATCC 33806]